jgi:hypothetical protein
MDDTIEARFVDETELLGQGGAVWDVCHGDGLLSNDS